MAARPLPARFRHLHKASLLVVFGVALAALPPAVLAAAYSLGSAVTAPASRSLSLEDALRMAQQHSYALQRADRNIEITRLQYQNSRTGYLPQVDSNLGASESQQGSTNLSDLTVPGQAAARLHVGVSETLDIGGRIHRQVDQARLNLEIARLDREVALRDLVLRVKSDYLNALRAQAHVEIDTQLIQQLESLLAEARQVVATRPPLPTPAIAAVPTAGHATAATPAAPLPPRPAPPAAGTAAGATANAPTTAAPPPPVEMSPSPDINSLQVSLSSARQVLTQSTTAMQLSMESLREDLQLPEGQALVLSGSLAYRPEHLDADRAIQLADTHRAELAAAMRRIELARIAVISAGDDRRPTMNLGVGGDLTLSGESPADVFSQIYHGPGGQGVRDWGANVQVNVPLAYFDWGNRSRTHQQAALNRAQALDDLRELRDQIGLQVRQAAIAVLQADNRLQTLPRTDQARKVLADREQQFLSGKISLSDLTNARDALRSAQVTDVDAHADYLLALAKMERAIGQPL